MADGNASPAQRERGLLALNITNALDFLRYGSSKESRPVTVCGFNWKLTLDRRETVTGHGRKMESRSDLAAIISCTVDDPQSSIKVRVKCRVGVRHATENDLEKEWTGSVAFDPVEDDGDDEFEFSGDKWLVDIELLAAHCEFFEAAFFGDLADRNKEELELQDVDPDDFETFKAVGYPPQETLNTDNIFAVVSLADRFGAKSLLDKCEAYMLEKLYPADAFKVLAVYAGLDDLKSKFLAAMSDKELDAWATPEGLRELSKENMALVLLENVNRRMKP